MKLTDKEIRFIDTYLNNSGIVYEDIRFEMTDHVATAMEAMEGDFYENFREYMIANKALSLRQISTLKRPRCIVHSDRWLVICSNPCRCY